MSCTNNDRRLNCGSTGEGQTAAEFADGTGSFSWVDATGRNNCAYKFGLLYRDFVDTCYNSFRTISGTETDENGVYVGYLEREKTNSQMWPCLPWIPPNTAGGARGFAQYFQNSGGWKNTVDPDMDLKNGVYTGTDDPNYIEAMRGMKWPNALHSVTGFTTLNNDFFGVNPSSYLAMDMRPYIDPVDGATFLHQNK
jgi:hypothetical protein